MQSLPPLWFHRAPSPSTAERRSSGAFGDEVKWTGRTTRLRGPFKNDFSRAGGGGLAKFDRKNRGCVDLVLTRGVQNLADVICTWPHSFRYGVLSRQADRRCGGAEGDLGPPSSLARPWPWLHQIFADLHEKAIVKMALGYKICSRQYRIRRLPWYTNEFLLHF